MLISSEELLLKLNKSRGKNAFLIRTLLLHGDTEAHEYNGSAAVYESVSGVWLFSLEHEGDFEMLLKELKQEVGYTFYVNSVRYFDEVKSCFGNLSMKEYRQYVIEKPCFSDKIIPAPEGVELVSIDRSWIDFILSIYHSKEFANAEYIGRCIDMNPAFGALYNGEKVGFILEHINGELGTIAVSENARGKNIGKLLMQRITPEYISQAEIGVGFVLKENVGSNGMLKNSNYSPAQDTIMWLYQ